MNDWSQNSRARLAADLASMGLTVEMTSAGLRVGEHGSSPTVWVAVDDAGLDVYLNHSATGAEVVFPDVSPIVGSYRLLLANIEEYVTAWGSGLKGIDIGRGGLTLHRDSEQPSPRPMGDRPLGGPNDDYGWLADPTAG